MLTELKYFIERLFRPTVIQFKGLSEHITGNRCYVGNILFTYNYFHQDGPQWKSSSSTITITKILIKDFKYLKQDSIRCWKVADINLGISNIYTEQEVLKILLERAVSISFN